MNILFLAVDVDLRRHRGDSVHVRELHRHLVGLGNDVVLVTGTPSESVAAGVTHASRPNSTLAQIRLGRNLAKGWADVVYERRTSPKLSFAISALTRTPFVLEVNGVPEDETLGSVGGTDGQGGPIRRRIRSFMYRRASAIVAVSAGIRNHLQGRYGIAPGRVWMVPNGANTLLFYPREKVSCRPKWELTPDDQVLCFVGNMTAWQGIDLLLAAVAEAHSRIPRLKLLIAGEGPELKRFEAKATELGLSSVARFRGKVPYEEIPELIGASDVCAAPIVASRKASPIKIFEYMACGRPVIVSDVDGIGEFVRSCGGGLVVEPGHRDGLAQAIEWILSHPRESQDMGTRARQAVVQTRSWEATARGVAEVLRAACATP